MSDLEIRLRQVLAGTPGVELGVLFGSHARGTAHRGSDVDVAVRLSRDSLAERREIELALGRAAGRPIDVVHVDESPPLLRFEIARGGKLLFERQPHVWADFRARAALDWWDWAPTARRIHASAAARLRESAHGPK